MSRSRTLRARVRILPAILASIPLGGLAAPLHADDFVGPDWVEDGKGDAGNTLQTAQQVKGQGGGIQNITGAVTGGGGFARGGGGDFQDIFLIFIDDPNAFVASTVPPGGEATFDTRLRLFRLDGRGVLGADDADAGVPQTILSNTATAGDAKIERPGVYGLAIHGHPTDPVTIGGLPMFPGAEPGATVAPTLAGATTPLGSWQPPVGSTGSYRIRVQGVRLIPEKCGAGGVCFEPQPGPGCADVDCCSRVCLLDPACCDAQWDIQCANIARSTCDGCGDPQAGPCLAPHPQPFCQDATCCETVCDLDPMCCIDAWDAVCVAIASTQCTAPCEDCLGDFNGDGLRDGADIGLMLGAWNGSGCPDLDHDGLVDGGDLGLLLGLLGPCPACGDPDSGGCLSPHVNPGCADDDCCTSVCVVDPSCCDANWDAACVALALDLCAASCGDPGAGSCLIAHPSPGCSNGACCAAVCDVLPRCCEISWDTLCVEFASTRPACGN